MIKFKKVAALGLVGVMAASAFVGCGKKKGADADVTVSNEGKVLNIYCWNTEFMARLVEQYPGFEAADKEDVSAGGKIGDVTVKFYQTANEGNAYQDNLDAHLEKQSSAEADDKIDIFLVEADYAVKYIDSDYTLKLSDIGIDADKDLPEQYDYTKKIVSDSEGNVKGSSWQATPGVLIYNRQIAKEVWGADDPETVQAHVKDWTTFEATAKELKDKGYYMLAGYDDAYRVFSNNMSSPWVKDGKLTLDSSITDWIEMTKRFSDAGYNKGASLWDSVWSGGFAKDQDVFCYFGPGWLADFSMALKDDAGNYTNSGVWMTTEGPANFYWGGTWLCVANGTDNADLVKDIILTMTGDEKVLENIVRTYDDFCNNETLMNKLAEDTTYQSKFLEANVLKYYTAGVSKIDLSNLSAYDQGCNEKIQSCMKDYFIGESSYEDALAKFKSEIKTVYPSVEVE